MGDSTERMRRKRSHNKGDHSDCDMRFCKPARKAWLDAEAKCYALALIEVLKSYGDPADYWYLFGERPYTDVLADLDGFDQEFDIVHHLRAKMNVRLALGERGIKPREPIKAPEPAEDSDTWSI
jgi:hypothetical protein